MCVYMYRHVKIMCVYMCVCINNMNVKNVMLKREARH